MILVIGNAGVYEWEAYSAVKHALQCRGHEAVLFRQDHCLENDFLTFLSEKSLFKCYVMIDGRKYDVDDFSGIWYLRPHLPRALLEYEPVEHRPFLEQQFKSMRQALWVIFRDKKWLNDPWLMSIAENKSYQLP